MYVYALSYRNPYDDGQTFALFLVAERLISTEDALASAVTAVSADSLGHEWVEAVAQGAVTGPLEIDGKLIQPSIAVVMD